MEGTVVLLSLTFVFVAMLVGLPLFVYKATAGERAGNEQYSEEEAELKRRPQKKIALNVLAIIVFVLLSVFSNVGFQETLIYAFVLYMYGADGINSFIAGTPMSFPYSGTTLLRVRDFAGRSVVLAFNLFVCSIGVYVLLSPT